MPSSLHPDHQGGNFFKKFLPFIGLLLLSVLLIYLSWPPAGIFPLGFIGLIPLLLAMDKMNSPEGKKQYGYYFLFLFLFYALTHIFSLTWLFRVSRLTFFLAIIIPSLVFGICVLPVLLIGKRLGSRWRNIAFVAAWIFSENINNITPYSILGSTLGMHPSLIQHYEFIGIEGGSVWILAGNVFGYRAVKQWINRKRGIPQAAGFISWLFVPVLISLFLYHNYTPQNETVKVAALHTNFETVTPDRNLYPDKVIDSLWALGAKDLDSNVELLLWPETIICNMGWMNNLSNESTLLNLKEKLRGSRNLTMCLGVNTFSLTDQRSDPYATLYPEGELYYYTHNLALVLNSVSAWKVRSKHRFIPFQERIPMLERFPFLADWIQIVGNQLKYTAYDYDQELMTTATGVTYIPVLCYESIFPRWMAKKSEEAELLTILANENWNKDLKGSLQYLYNNVGMAIQSRIPIVKSSNGGISSVISPRGDVIGEKRSDEKNFGLIVCDVEKASEEGTVYNRISGLFFYSSIIIFFVAIFVALFKKK